MKEKRLAVMKSVTLAFLPPTVSLAGSERASAADKEEICAAGSEIEDPQVKSRRE